MTKRPYKRKLSNYYLMGEIQLSTMLWVAFACALICVVLGSLIYQQEQSANESIGSIIDFAEFNETPGGEGVGSDIQSNFIKEDLEKGKQKLILQMILVFAALISVATLYVLLLTHRMAGPVYKMGLYFDKMANGRLQSIWPLRKGDLLNDYFETFSDVHTSLRNKHLNNAEFINESLELFDFTQEDKTRIEAFFSSRVTQLKTD